LNTALNALQTVQGDDYTSYKTLWKLWAAMIAKDPDLLPGLFDFYFDLLRALPWKSPPPPFADLAEVHRFFHALTGIGYLDSQASRAEGWRLLGPRHGEHLDLIQVATALPDHEIAPLHLRGDSGRWGDIPRFMFEFAARLVPYGDEFDTFRWALSRLLPAFLRAFPAQDATLLTDILGHHPDVAEETADLIRFHLIDRDDPQAPFLSTIATDILGFHVDKTDPLHRAGPEILTRVLRDAATWPEERRGLFVDHLLLPPLDTAPRTREEAIAETSDAVARWRTILAKDAYEGALGISASQRREWDRERSRQAEADHALAETDFDAWVAGRRDKAVRRIAVSRLSRAIFEVAAKHLSGPSRERVQAYLDETTATANRLKRFPMPTPADTRFKDLGFKLLVIEALMYQRDLLQPRFDIRAFAREYETREIDVDSEGYEIIPEARDYFWTLAIPDDLLAQVDSLHQSSGLDGGSEVIYNLMPFWDPGCGDEPVAVTTKAVADLALLPNLKRISGLENSDPEPALLEALEARGVVLIDEDDA
jgi:hypothetical protein